MASDNTFKNHPKNKEFKILAHPMFWIARVNAQYLQTMEKDLKPMGLDIAQWRIAMILRAYAKLPVSKISQLAVNRLSTTTKLIQRMEKNGLLKTQKDSKDERVTLISLTKKGRNVLDESLEKTHYIFPRIFDNIRTEDLENLIRTLNKMHDNLLK